MPRLLIMLLLAASLVLTACGGDESAGPSETTTPQGPVGGGNLQQYCEKVVELEAIPEPYFDPDAPAEERKVQARKHARERILPLAEQLPALAPAEVRSDNELLNEGTRRIARHGEPFRELRDRKRQAARTRVHAHDLQKCGWQRIDVSGFDYRFEGIPSVLVGGNTFSFEFKNQGKEVHELVLFRLHDDATEPVDVIFSQGEKQAQAKAKLLGGTSALSGQSAFQVARLEPGRYAAVCFIPVGSGAKGPPHLSKGELTEFQVS